MTTTTERAICDGSDPPGCCQPPREERIARLRAAEAAAHDRCPERCPRCGEPEPVCLYPETGVWQCANRECEDVFDATEDGEWR